MKFTDFGVILLVFGFAVTYFTSYFLGRLVLRKIIKRDLISLPFSVTLPIYIAFGLSILVIVYFGLAIVALSVIAPILALVGSLLVTLLGYTHTRFEFSRLRKSVESVNLVPLTLFGLSLLFFVGSAAYMHWPPPGDVMNLHGPMVSLIEYHSRVPTTLDPLVKNANVQYPPGFSVFVATTNTFLHLYPAQAVLLTATCVVALIPSIIYSLTFILTRSIAFSSLGFLSVFAIHPASLETWIVGYFYNGPYPNLMGYLLILTFATLVAVEERNNVKNSFAKQLLSPSIIVATFLVLVYPNFVLLIALFILMFSIAVLFSNRHHVFKHISIGLRAIQKTNRKMLILKLLFAVSLLCLASLMLAKYAQFYLPIGLLHPEDPRAFELRASNYAISPFFFVDHVNGILIIVAGFISGYLIVRKHTFGLPILYLVILVPAIISLNSQLFPYVAYILPDRSIIICSVLSWPLVLAGIQSVTTSPASARNTLKRSNVSSSVRVTRKKLLSLMRKLALCTLLILLIPSLFSYATFEITQRRGWFAHTSWFPEDMAALEWINKNVPPTDLILNDGSFTSRFATSLSSKNLTISRLTVRCEAERAENLLEIWLEPTNVAKFVSLLEEWNVSYILSTSEWGFASGAKTSARFYKGKPFEPEVYAKLFDTYPFLTTVFGQGWTRVYKVDVQDVGIETVSILPKDRWAEGEFFTSNAWENGTIGAPILSDDTDQNFQGDEDSLRLQIPMGEDRFWGIQHKLDDFRNWTSADFLTFWILSSSQRGLSVRIEDVIGNSIRYDFVTENGSWQEVFVPLYSQTEKGSINFADIDAIRIVTGWNKPFPQAGDVLILDRLNLLYITVGNN